MWNEETKWTAGVLQDLQESHLDILSSIKHKDLTGTESEILCWGNFAVLQVTRTAFPTYL